MKMYNRYIKRCEEFTICSEVGDANVVALEEAKDRYTLYLSLIHI